MEKIIVPVDFTAFSETALKTAAFLAKKNDAEIIAVHTLELSDAFFTKSDSFESQEVAFYLNIASKKFEEFLDKDYLKGLNVSSIIKKFKIYDEIDELVKSENASIVVMGSHGASKFQDLFVGSNTERVIRNSTVPVMIVKEKPILEDVKVAVFATNFDVEDFGPYEEVKELLANQNTVVKLLFVNTPGSNFKSTSEIEKLSNNFIQKINGNQLQKSDIDFISEYTVEKGIFSYVQENKTDMIIMSTEGRKGLSQMFNHSITESIKRDSILPILSMKTVK